MDESKIEKRYPDMHIVILDGEGNAVWGAPPEGIEIDEIAQIVCETQQDKFPDRKVHFSVMHTGNSKTRGSLDLVTIAVTNLISNAVKFSPEDAVIEVESAPGQSSRFTLCLAKL